MAEWKGVHNQNCFLVRFNVKPECREKFLLAVQELMDKAAEYYEKECTFSFQGWGRDPNQWVAIASWRSEDFLNNVLRQQPFFKDVNERMLDSSSSVIMEQFSGMKHDRSVFDMYPAGTSKIHPKGKDSSLEYVFL